MWLLLEHLFNKRNFSYIEVEFCWGTLKQVCGQNIRAICVQRSNDSWFCNSHCISHSRSLVNLRLSQLVRLLNRGSKGLMYCSKPYSTRILNPIVYRCFLALAQKIILYLYRIRILYKCCGKAPPFLKGEAIYILFYGKAKRAQFPIKMGNGRAII